MAKCTANQAPGSEAPISNHPLLIAGSGCASLWISQSNVERLTTKCHPQMKFGNKTNIMRSSPFTVWADRLSTLRQTTGRRWICNRSKIYIQQSYSLQSWRKCVIGDVTNLQFTSMCGSTGISCPINNLCDFFFFLFHFKYVHAQKVTKLTQSPAVWVD